MSALGGFFNPDSKFSVFMSRIFDLMVLNIVFIIMCIPFFTIGANITAVYYVTLKMAKNEESYIWKAYWKSFRENFVQATIIWLITLAIGLVLGADFRLMKFMSTNPNIVTVLRYIFMILLVFFLFYYIFVFPVLSKFYNTIKRTIINALMMSIRHLPQTLLMIAVSAAPVLVFLFVPTLTSYVMLFMILLGFSTIFYVNSLFLAKIFDKYIPKEDEEESEEDTEGNESISDLNQSESNVTPYELFTDKQPESSEEKDPE